MQLFRSRGQKLHVRQVDWLLLGTLYNGKATSRFWQLLHFSERETRKKQHLMDALPRKKFFGKNSSLFLRNMSITS